MSLRIVIKGLQGVHTLDGADAPFSVGGSGHDLPIPGSGQTEPMAYLGVEEDHLFVQPAGVGGPVIVNGVPVTTSGWLRDGDDLQVGNAHIAVRVEGQRVHLTVSVPINEPATQPPEPIHHPSAADPAGRAVPVQPVRYSPQVPQKKRRTLSWTPRWVTLIVTVL